MILGVAEQEVPMKKDFLEEIVSERSARNPNFPALVQAAAERRELLRALAKEREASGFTQTEVAAAMGTRSLRSLGSSRRTSTRSSRLSRSSPPCSGSGSNGAS
jgi:hypothetical protein